MSAQDQAQRPRIVVGVDGSPSADAALRWAIEQARLAGGEVEAVIAWHFPAPIAGIGTAPIGVYDPTAFRDYAEKALTGAIGRAGPAGTVSVRPRVVQGNAAHVLLTEARNASLLVVGSRGHGGFAGLLLGSVSQHCVHHARCPVVVIRPPGPG